MKAELFETELTASTLIIFCPLAGFKVIQRSTRATTRRTRSFPSPRGVQGYPTTWCSRSSRWRTRSFPSPRGVQGYPTTRRSIRIAAWRRSFRPLAGFKVIQHSEFDRKALNATWFPSPRGVQGYPTWLSASGNRRRQSGFRPLAGFKVIQQYYVWLYDRDKMCFRPLAGFKVIQR